MQFGSAPARLENPPSTPKGSRLLAERGWWGQAFPRGLGGRRGAGCGEPSSRPVPAGCTVLGDRLAEVVSHDVLWWAKHPQQGISFLRIIESYSSSLLLLALETLPLAFFSSSSPRLLEEQPEAALAIVPRKRCGRSLCPVRARGLAPRAGTASVHGSPSDTRGGWGSRGSEGVPRLPGRGGPALPAPCPGRPSEKGRASRALAAGG